MINAARSEDHVLAPVAVLPVHAIDLAAMPIKFAFSISKSMLGIVQVPNILWLSNLQDNLLEFLMIDMINDNI
jgi:hypothetical protein